VGGCRLLKLFFNSLHPHSCWRTPHLPLPIPKIPKRHLKIAKPAKVEKSYLSRS
jgi:hypothetical protein